MEEKKISDNSISLAEREHIKHCNEKNEKYIFDKSVHLDEREHIKYCNEIPVWKPEIYFKEVMKKWKGFTCIISGSRMAGKSQFLKNLLVGEPKLASQFDFVVVFSRTLVNGFYQSFLDTTLLFPEFHDGVIETMKNLYSEAKKKGKKFKWLCILDDIVDAKSKYNKSVMDLFLCGRHYGASIFYLTQKLGLMSTSFMANTMIFVILFAGSRAEKEYISEKVLSEAIDDKFSHLTLTKVERVAYLVQTEVCKDYNAIVVLPYEKIKVHRFKAPLINFTKRKKKIAEPVIKLEN
jgi:hypothetical protein